MCKEIKGINASADVGEYLGFKLNVTFDSFNNKFVMNVKGAYYVTFEVDSGDRIEFSMSGSEYGMLIEGDAGTLNFQGTRYLGFERK